MSELNIAGSNMTVELRDNKLYAKAQTGNKQWVAVITDTHPKYNYDRDFAAYQKPKTSDRDSGTATVEDGAVIERVRYTHSGKNRKDSFYQLVDGEAYEIDESDVEAALDGEIIPDIEPETHECEECGDEFDTSHGLAVHEGIKHSDDDAEVTANADTADATPEIVADGGLNVRDRDEVRGTGDEVRNYRADGMLYAYRSDDGDHHIVVSRGREPGDKWEKRVPAERTRVVPGQKLWTVPDNWEHRATSKRDTIAYGLYRVPETGHWVKLSHSTNDRVVDCWYQVKSVGDLTAEPVGDLGTSHEVRTLASEYVEEYDADGVEEDAEALREVAANWTVVEEDLRETTEWVASEGLDELSASGQPVPVDSDWQVEFHQDRVFRPGEALKREMNLSEYEIPLSVLLDELRDAGLLPSYYAFELSLDSSAVGMEYYTRALEEAGCSSPETLDYYWVEIAGVTQTERADERGVDQSTVSGNVSKARGKLDR